MAKRINIKHLIQSQFMRDLPIVILGCAIAALATDAFMIPNGLAAGGLTGAATIIAELGRRAGISLPVGMQTIVMNAVLLLVVVRAGGVRYAVQTITGFFFFGVFTDLFAPFVLPVGANDLMLSAIWGGIISGFGYGLVFRCGANTGGSDTIGQIIARKSSLPVGATVMAIDVAVCAASAPVFSVVNALYAALAMVIMGYVVDMVVDGGNRQRAAIIISDAYADIEYDILHEMDRGCTRLMAQGSWTNKDRPVLFFVLSKREVSIIKTIVAQHDPNALLVITDVNEAIGYGFKAVES
ncbi:MAG: YitT family protein [Coriobacteriaceae bacterium]|nr:YitT family protein [Coriobacteriaceae bacterium]